MDMTNLISISNFDYIKGTLEHMKININFNLNKVKEVMDLINKAAIGVIGPTKRLKAFFVNDIKQYKNKYEDILEKIESKQRVVENQKKENIDEIPSMHSFIEEYQLNSTLNNDHIKLVEKLDRMITIATLFNNLFNSHEFDSLIKEFKKMESEEGNGLTNGNIINAMLVDEETESIEHESTNKKTKKRKRPDTDKKKKLHLKKKKKAKHEEGGFVIGLDGCKGNQRESDSEENEKDKSMKRLSDDEYTDKIKEAFPNYKGITKTFLTRKLLKNVIWSSEYNYICGDINKFHREIVKSGTYKYVKLVITMEDNKYCDLHSDFVNFILKELLKNSICRFSNNIITVAGEMAVELEEFVDKIKNIDIHKKFKVNLIKVSVHAFLEELVTTEFDTKSSYSSFQDGELENFAKEYEKLKIIRKYWKDLKLIK